uniref:Uncharacterized protein n=1 Tax=Arundo donax TaxID=35708 RepID=A0A0A9FLL4_ARUDO
MRTLPRSSLGSLAPYLPVATAAGGLHSSIGIHLFASSALHQSPVHTPL